MHNNGESIVVERILNAPVEHVWQALTDPELLKRWFAKEAKVVAERGGPYELFWEPANPERNSTLGCRVTHAEPQRWLAFTWRGPTIYDDPMNEGDPPPRPTWARVRFERHGEGKTAVRVEHLGWGVGERWEEARAWTERAWGNALENLAAFLHGGTLPHPQLVVA